jgi:uncharacterized membrane protein
MSRLQLLWSRLRSNLWFVPTVIVVSASTLALVLVELESLVGIEQTARFPRLFGAGAEGARGMLSAIASATITVAGVVFSVTIVALSQTATQHTSRVLRNFMSDRTNQVVLGAFVGIHAYCLIVLRTIRGGDADPFVPSLATIGGVALAFVGIGLLIHFIHHIATALQSSRILAAIHRETKRSIERLYPEPLGEADQGGEEVEAIDGAGTWLRLPASSTGYIQSVAGEPLLDIACEYDAVVRLPNRIGDFVVESMPLVEIDARSPLDDAARERLQKAIVIGEQRTAEQDVAFGLRQIADIALKALSPAVNDPTTARMCIDYLGALLLELSRRRFPSQRRYVEGKLRLIAALPTFDALVGVATAEVVEASRGQADVLCRIVDALVLATTATASHARRAALLAPLARVAAHADDIADHARGAQLRERIAPFLRAGRPPGEPG